MEAKKSHGNINCHLQAGEPGKLVVESEGLRMGCQWCKYQFELESPRTSRIIVLEQEKIGVSAQAKRVNSPFLSPIVLHRPSTNLMMATQIEMLI